MAVIQEIRTIRIGERPNLVWVELVDADGRVGLGESFRGAATVEAAIHELVAPQLLGQEADAIEGLSRLLTQPYVGFGGSGAEIRAASAVDIALWDLKGQRLDTPVYNLLGGPVRPDIPVYNTCAGYAYNSQGARRRSVSGTEEAAGPYDDQIAFMRDAGELARSLLDEGISAMKIWPFDGYATAPASHHIRLADLKAGLEPFARIRRAVGDRMDVMCELHSLWGGAAARRICQGLEDYGVFWAEDPIGKSDDAAALADLRRHTRTPLCLSETLGGLTRYRDLLERRAVDYVMIDIAWCGGLTPARKIAALAEAAAVPITPHDCTGPVVLWAGVHFSLTAATAIFQEVVRAYLATWYRDLVTVLPTLENGRIRPPAAPGLGTALRPEVKTRSDAVVRVSAR
ncbi:MAG: mandelate racemase/muconate lactonizing enzyme family protein [Planctomycetes bacterium]|nr:mandelate racemase/muconate lactonizing enzyme family protein [Planctomycetota bacterium]